MPVFAPELCSEVQGFEPGFYRQLESVEARHFWFRARNALIVWAVGKYAPQARGLLEIGCGRGGVLEALGKAFPTLALTGTEVLMEGLRQTKKRVPRADLMQMDATRLPFRDEFDTAGAFDVLEHVATDSMVVTQLYSALKPGGTLFVTVPQHKWLWSAHDERARHLRRYGRQELAETLKRGGFSIVRVTSFVSLLLPALFLARRRASAGDEAGRDATAEFQISPPANFVGATTMAAERVLIALGLSFPVGGSLLVVARKATASSTK